MLVDDSENVPALGDVCLGLFLADGGGYLIGDLFDWHHPEEIVAFCHCRINKTWANIRDVNMVAALISLLAQSLHIIDLVGFCRAVGWSHRFASQSASRRDGDEVAVALLLEDVVERINDKRPACDVGVNSRTFNSIVECGIDVARARANDGEVNVFQFGTEDVNCLRSFIKFGYVRCGGDGVIGIFLAQFVKQMCPSAYDTDVVALSSVLFKECPANAGGCSDDDDGLLFHARFVFCEHKDIRNDTIKPSTKFENRLPRAKI